MKKVGLLALALYCGIIYTACGKEDTVYFEPDTQMESEEVTEAVDVYKRQGWKKRMLLSCMRP